MAWKRNFQLCKSSFCQPFMRVQQKSALARKRLNQQKYTRLKAQFPVQPNQKVGTPESSGCKREKRRRRHSLPFNFSDTLATHSHQIFRRMEMTDYGFPRGRVIDASSGSVIRGVGVLIGVVL